VPVLNVYRYTINADLKSASPNAPVIFEIDTYVSNFVDYKTC
jgi:hypothetical protein